MLVTMELWYKHLEMDTLYTVRTSRLTVLTAAPCCKSTLTTSFLPLLAAAMRGVTPSWLARLGLAPFSRRYSVTMENPLEEGWSSIGVPSCRNGGRGGGGGRGEVGGREGESGRGRGESGREGEGSRKGVVKLYKLEHAGLIVDFQATFLSLLSGSLVCELCIDASIF